jgi:hypothetical protein
MQVLLQRWARLPRSQTRTAPRVPYNNISAQLQTSQKLLAVIVVLCIWYIAPPLILGHLGGGQEQADGGKGP